MYPSVNKEIQEGLINTYKESGFFPEWASPGHRGCMVGNNSASVLADAYLKGVKVKDTEALFEGIVSGTENVHPEVSSTGRLGHEYYNTLGYVPSTMSTSTKMQPVHLNTPTMTGAYTSSERPLASRKAK